MPRFSIIIPCYNGERWLDQAIRSCLAQTARDLEVIVVDDGSTDGSADIAAAYVASDARVVAIQEANRGVGAARNAGLAIAKGDYVNFLDADDVLASEKLAVQGAVLDENPDIACVFCDGRGIDADGRVFMDHIVDPRRFAGPESFFDLFFSGGQFPPLIPLLRRTVATAAGDFDTDRAVAGCADTAYWLRVALTGARFHYVDRVLCSYRTTAGNMSSDHEAMERAAELVYAKLLRDAPDACARSLRKLQARLNDNDVALAALRSIVSPSRAELRAAQDGWRVTRESLHDAQQRLDSLRSLISRKVLSHPMTRIVICGTGNSSRRLWEALAPRHDVDITAFIDADTRREGRHFLAAAIQPPAWLRTGEWDAVAVASSDVDEWAPRFQDAGVDAVRIIELPADDIAALSAAVVARFPDPLAGRLAGAGPRAGIRVGIFGTGAAALKVWEVLAELDTADAIWFADNNPQQHGRSILGLDVIAPAAIPHAPFDAIVIGSMARDAILEQLVSLGVPASRIIAADVVGPIQALQRQLALALDALNARVAA